MSWNIRIAGKAKIALAQAIAAQTQMPHGVKEIIGDQLNACAEPLEGEVLVVESQGHVDSPQQPSSYGTGGEAKFRVYLLSVVG